MQEIKKIDKRSLANIVATIISILVFLLVFCLSILNVMNIVGQSYFSGSVVAVFLFNIGSGLIIGILAGAIALIPGYLLGYAMGLAYDIFAKRFGGIKIELIENNK